MRVTIIIHEATEPPISYDLHGRTDDELLELNEEAHRHLDYAFVVAKIVNGTTPPRPERVTCDHRSFTHGVPESGIRSKDCVENGLVR